MRSARTVWGDAVVLALVIFRTAMCIDLEVLLTERVLAVLAVEGQKVDEKASRGRSTAFRCREEMCSRSGAGEDEENDI